MNDRELGRPGPKTPLDIPQALAVGELRKRHAQKLIEVTEPTNVEIAAILRHQSAKRVPRREFHDLPNTSLPACIDTSPEIPERLPE